MFSIKASRSGQPSRSNTPLQTLQPPTRPSSTAPPATATVSAPANCASVRNTFYDPSPIHRRNTPTPVPVSRRSPSPSPTPSPPVSHAAGRDRDDSEDGDGDGDGDGSVARDRLTPLPPIPHLPPLPNFAAPPAHLDLSSSGRNQGTPIAAPGFGYGVTGSTPDGAGVRAQSLPPPPRGLRTSGAAASRTGLFSFGRRVSGTGAGALGSLADTSGTGTFGSISPAHNHQLYTQNHTHGHFQQQQRHAHHVPSPSVERYIPPFDDSFEASFDLAPPFEIARLRDSAHVRGKYSAGAGTAGGDSGSGGGANNGGGGGANSGAQYYHPNESTFSIGVSSATPRKGWWNCFDGLFGWWPKAEDVYDHAVAARSATF